MQLSITREVGVERIILFLAIFRAVLQFSVEDMTAIHALTTVFALGKGFIMLNILFIHKRTVHKRDWAPSSPTELLNDFQFALKLVDFDR